MGKGPKVEQKQDTKTVQDTTQEQDSQYTGGTGGGREETGIGHTETEAERQQREETERREKGEQISAGKGTTEQKGSTRNIYGTVQFDDTADMSTWRNMIAAQQKGQRDPTIPFRAANAKKEMGRMWQNPFGSATTPETREAMMRQVFSGIDQQAGQETLQDAYNMGQKNLQLLGMQGELARMKQPFRELLGTESTGLSATDQTNRVTSDNVSTGISNMFGTDKQTSDNIQKQISDFFGYNFGQSSGTSTGHAEGSQTGTSTTQQNQNVLGQVLGGIGGAAAAKM